MNASLAKAKEITMIDGFDIEDTFMNRMLIEYEKLQRKMERLNAYAEDNYYELNDLEHYLLDQQSEAMSSYSMALNARITYYAERGK